MKPVLNLSRRSLLTRFAGAAVTKINYYIANNGLDTNTGTSTGAALATYPAAAASALASPNSNIVIHGNTTYSQLNYTTAPALSGVTIKGDGTGTPPLFDGTTIIPASAWTPYTTVATNPSLIVNGDGEKVGTSFMGTYPYEWHAFVGSASTITSVTDVKHSGSRSTRLMYNGSIVLGCVTSQKVPAGTDLTIKFWVLSADGTSKLPYSVSRSTSAGTTYYDDSTNSWVTTEKQNYLTPPTTWTEYTVTLSTDLDASYDFYFNKSGTAGSTFWVDDVTAFPTKLIASSPNTYVTSAPSSPGTLVDIVTNKFYLPTSAGDINRLPDGQWGYDSTTFLLYLRLDSGAPPNDMIYSTRGSGVVVKNGNNVAVSGIDFKYIRGRAIDFQYAPSCSATDINSDHVGAQHDYASANGTIYGFQADGLVLRRINVSNANTDGINILDCKNTLIEDYESSFNYGGAADCIQYDANATVADGNPTMRRFHLNQVGTPSPKGCIIDFMSNGLFEDGEVSGGLFGISTPASTCTIQRVIAHDVVHNGDGFGLGANGTGTLTGNTIQDCLVYYCDHGIQYNQGNQINTVLRRSTVYGNTYGMYINASSLDGGLVEDCILWQPNRTTPVIYNEAASTLSKFTIRNCIIGPEIPGVPLIKWGTATYDTLAAFIAAGGKVTNSSSADPQFKNPNGLDFDLTAGSPALTMSTTGGRIGVDPALLKPGPAFAPGGASKTPSWAPGKYALTAPGKPGLSVVRGLGKVTATVTAPTSNGNVAITRYNLYRDTVPSVTKSSQLVASRISLSAGVITDSTGTFEAPYYYAVSAVNKVGESVLSTVVGPIAPGTPVPDIAAITVSQAPSKIVISGSASGADTYKIYRGTSTNSQSATPIASGVPLPYSDTSGTTGTTYYYKVKGTNSYGDATSYSNEVSSVPGPADIISFTDNFNRADATGGLGNGWTLLTGASADTGFISGNQAGTAFDVATSRYYAAPTTPSGVAYWSSVTVSAMPDYTTPHPGAYIRGVVSGSTASHYSVRYEQTAGGWVFRRTSAGTITSTRTIPAPTPATPYTLRIGSDNSGNITWMNGDVILGTFADSSPLPASGVGGAYLRSLSASDDKQRISSVLVGTSQLPPAVPVLSIGISSTSPAVSGVSAGASTFKIYRGTSAGAESTTPLASGVTLPYVDTSAISGTRYFYTAKGTNAAGDSAVSNEVSTTPGLAETTAFTDPFTRANQTGGFGNGWVLTDTSVVDTGIISSNQVGYTYPGAATTRYWQAPVTLSSPNQWVTFTPVLSPGGVVPYPGVFLRGTVVNNTLTAYMIRYNPQAVTWDFYRMINGTASLMTSVAAGASQDPTTSRVPRYEVDANNVLSVKLNGTLKASYTDTAVNAITTGSLCGITMRSTSASNDVQRGDNFSCGVLAGG